MTDTKLNGAPENFKSTMLSKVSAAVKSILATKEERKELNAMIMGELDALEAHGMPKAAVRMAMTYLDWDERKQAGFDRAYALVREAMGQPVQSDLIDWLKTAPLSEPKADDAA